ncbi:hypothetical protein [Rickettsiella endosymbiont of Rhagonycha lignosa]|uniref:hypothetical protein n=1 Tax=Rickettsiella endosymbiont of Rhagonycha lignosa TaxID=3077937 RepID=UPI00313C7228
MNINDNEIVFGQGLSIIFYEVNDENLAPYNQTALWVNAQYYLKFIKDEKDGRKETLIPGRGKLEEFKKSFHNLKSKINEKKPLLENDLKFLPILPEFKLSLTSNDSDKESAYGSNNSSEVSFSSEQFSEKNLDAQQVKSNKSLSRIPSLIRSNTNTSLFSNNSRRESPKIFNFDIKGKLVVLSKNHPFLENIKPERKKIPQSYRDAIRIDNLTDDEMDDLSNNYVNKAIAVSKFNLKA